MDIEWLKSSFSTDTDNCVELARVEASLLLRESDAPDTQLDSRAPQLSSLLRFLKAADDDICQLRI
ncbi:hypothetical protein N566_12100 [Streptomycetaceae bacterium MP113-05]|nr:hypothetical protein N566_12100 [Streptomycetaceae bacterium MP113-05]